MKNPYLTWAHIGSVVLNPRPVGQPDSAFYAECVIGEPLVVLPSQREVLRVMANGCGCVAALDARDGSVLGQVPIDGLLDVDDSHEDYEEAYEEAFDEWTLGLERLVLALR